MNSLLFQNKIIGYAAGTIQLLLLFIVGSFFDNQAPENGNMLGWTLIGASHWNVYVQMIAAFLLILFQAFMLDIMITSKNIYERNTGVPFLLYTLFMGAHPALKTFSPALIALTFIIFNLWILLNMYQQKKAMFACFNTGFITSIATLFWFPAIVFHLFNFIACAIIRPVSYKDAIAFIIGGTLPFLYLACFYIALPVEFTHYPEFLINNIHSSFSHIRFTPAIWTYAIAVFILLNLALLSFIQTFSRLKIISRRFFNVVILIPLFLIVGIPLAESPNGSHFTAIVIPFTVLLSQVLIETKDERVLKIGLICFFLLVLWLQIDWYFEISFSILE